MEFISDRVSCNKLKGLWCNIIIVNVHAPLEDRDYGIKYSFNEELEQLLDQLLL